MSHRVTARSPGIFDHQDMVRTIQIWTLKCDMNVLMVLISYCGARILFGCFFRRRGASNE